MEGGGGKTANMERGKKEGKKKTWRGLKEKDSNNL